MINSGNSQNGREEKDVSSRNGVYILMDRIDTSAVKGAIKWIIEENLKTTDRKEELTLIINSPGGYLSDCFALIDVMKGSAIPIKTVGLGIVASCGLLIFLAGEKGHRVLTPNTVILSHQFSAGLFGKEHELVARQKYMQQISDMMMTHYRKTTGLTAKQIKQYLLPPEDKWLTAKEAKDLGICDRIKVMY